MAGRSRNYRQGSNGKTEDMLETENQHRADGLVNKVSRLKSLAFDIENEAHGQNQYIDGMNTDFDSSTGLLTGSVSRLTHMVSSTKGNRRLMCYIVIFLVVAFFLVYFIISRFRT